MKTKLFLILLFISSFTFAQWSVVGTSQFTDDAEDVALALNTSGEPYVVYSDTSVDGMVHVKKFDGTNWVEIGSNTSPAVVPTHLSIAINPVTGQPWITYLDNTNKQVVSYFDGTNWVVDTADVFLGEVPLTKVQLKIAANGDATIATTVHNVALYLDMLKVLRKNNGQTTWAVFNQTVTSKSFDLVTANKVAYADAPVSVEKRTIKEYLSNLWTTIYSTSTATMLNDGVMASDINKIIYNKHNGGNPLLTGENGIPNPPNNQNSKQRVHQLIYNSANQSHYVFFIESNNALRVLRKFDFLPSWVDLSPGLTMAANSSAKMEINAAGDTVYIAYMDANKVTVQKYTITYFPQPIIYVNHAATGTNDGSSWTNAYTDLQSAIDASIYNFSEIWVAQGTYTPGTARTDTFLITDEVKIYGGFNATETQLDQRDPNTNITILSGDLNGDDNATLTEVEATRQDNAYHIVTIKGSFGNHTNGFIDGFTITGGNANGSLSNSCSTPKPQQYDHRVGGAIYSNPEYSTNKVYMDFNNCIVEKNTATISAVYDTFGPCGATGTHSRARFLRCTIRDNYSLNNANLRFAASATYDNRRYGSFYNCLIYNNESANATSVMYLGSGRCYVYVKNCTITENVSSINKTIKIVGAPYSTLSNNIIYNNGGFQPLDLTAPNPTATTNIIHGGQLASSTANPLFTDAANDDFTLQSSSPAIDFGTNALSSGNLDLIGNVRITNGNVDLGCYEYASYPYMDLSRIYVDATATGFNSGYSWQNAFPSLQDALTLLNSGNQPNVTEVWIATGTYTPDASDNTKYFNINKPNITVYGGFDGTETTISQRNIANNPTILSGDLNGDDIGVDFTGYNRSENSIHVVIINQNTITLDGLQINDGQASNGNSAGILVHPAVTSFNIKNCELNNNVALTGAALQFIPGAAADTSISIENCIINNNLGRYGTIYIYTNNGYRTLNLDITNSLFTNNISKDLNGTDKGFTGSAMWIRAYSTGSVVNTTITNCTFANNSDIGTQANCERGALALSRRTDGASNHQVAVNNCIFWGNTTGGGLGTASLNKAHVAMANGVHVKNSIGQDNFATNTTSTSNITNLDPLFVDAANNDFTLQSGSPAIDTGDNSLVPAASVVDLLQNDRIYNTTVDMGCYEYGASPVVAVNDMNNNLAFTVYPNPVKDVLNIKMGTNLSQVTIYNLQGQKVINSSTKQVNVSNLSKGIYLIKIEDENGNTATEKFIKE